MEDPEVLAARAKLAQRFGGSTKMGGKGSMKRKAKVPHKKSMVDDKVLSQSIKKLGIQPLPAIQEVNFFQQDNKVLHFINPKVQANIKDNFFVIQGTNQVKTIKELMPGIINQLGPQSVKVLQEIMQQAKDKKIEQDEIPDLIDENFEDIANEDQVKGNLSNI